MRSSKPISHRLFNGTQPLFGRRVLKLRLWLLRLRLCLLHVQQEVAHSPSHRLVGRDDVAAAVANDKALHSRGGTRGRAKEEE